MLKKLNYKQKNILMLLAAIIVGYFAYSRAITATLNLKSECTVLEEQSLQAESAADEIKLVQLELANINRMLGNGKKNLGDINRELVEFVTQKAFQKNMLLKDFPEVHAYQGAQMNLYTQQCELQGNFKNIVELIHDLEKEFATINIASVRYYSKQDIKTKKNYLYAECFIQTIHKN